MIRISWILALVLFCSSIAQAQNNPMPIPGSQPKPTLSGSWTDYGTNTYHVTIKQSGSSVVATYDDPYVCDPRDGGPKQSTADDFRATLSGNQLTGQITVCSFGKGNKQGTGLRKADLRLTISADGNSLNGTYHNFIANREDGVELRRDCSSANYDIAPHVQAGIGGDLFDNTPNSLVPCESCQDSKWLMIDVHFYSQQQVVSDAIGVTGEINPHYECTYTYEATWRCPTTGTITHRRTFKKVAQACVHYG